MAASHASGPEIVYGIPFDPNYNSAGGNPDAGPSVTYQGDAVLDVRYPYQPGITGPGRVNAFLDSPYIVMVDAVPATANAAIAPAAQATSGTPLSLSAANAPGISVGVPVLPFGASPSGVVAAVGLDMGLATFGTVAGSAIVTTPAANNILQPGLNVLVQQGTAWVGATVQSVSANGLTAVLSATMAVAAAAATVIAGNGSGQRNVVPSYFTPYLMSGAAAIFDATEALCRAVGIASTNTADIGWTVKFSGYDLFGVPMTETIAVAAGANSFGRKAFKFITSAVPIKAGGGVSTGIFAAVTSDTFGLSMRADKWEYMNCYWAGAFLTVSSGFTVADATNPATSTTGDIRGTLQVSSYGQSGTFAAGGASNGARRLALFQTLASAAVVAATPMNPASLFGVNQA